MYARNCSSDPALAKAAASDPSPLNEMEQLVSAARLLEILWDKACRPSLRWLRRQQKNRAIPYIRIGRRIWFCPSQVLTHLRTHKQSQAQRTIRRLSRPASRTSQDGSAAVGQLPAGTASANAPSGQSNVG